MKRFIIIPLVLIILLFSFLYTNSQKNYEKIKSMQEQADVEMVVQTPEETYTLEEIALHASQTDCWTAVDGKVYDLTPYMEDHPPGVESIARMCGIDATESYNKKHGGEEEADRILESLVIGTLAQ